MDKIEISKSDLEEKERKRIAEINALSHLELLERFFVIQKLSYKLTFCASLKKFSS